MSEYHSFSLTHHLPKNSIKNNAMNNDGKQLQLQHLQQQQQQQQQRQQQQQHNFHFNQNNENNQPELINLNDPNASAVALTSDHKQNSDIDWPNHHQTTNFQNLDSILNNVPNYNHQRNHTAPATSNSFHPLFDFLPFGDTSSHGLIMPASSQNQQNNNDSDETNDIHHTISNYNVNLSIFLF
jgi:hypothetical protein